MIKRMVVTTDGINYIGRVKTKRPAGYRVRGVQSWKSKKFDESFYDAQDSNVIQKDLPNYIQERFWDDAEDIINDTIDDIEFEVLYDSFQNRLHKRLVRYRQKLLMNDWSYWVTFTYDNKKETPEGFEKRLIIAFNNLAKRNGWRIIGGWENGELEGRLHFHAFVYVPEGQMVGELVNCSRYSYKRHRMEYYVDNTYFSERFGMSDWIKINREDVVSGGLANYLVKYVVKSGCKLFYSRGIPSDFVTEVDTEKDVLLSFRNYGVKHILMNVKNGMKGLQMLFNMDIDYTDAFVFDENTTGFCDDESKLVTIYS